MASGDISKARPIKIECTPYPRGHSHGKGKPKGKTGEYPGTYGIRQVK